MDKSLDRSVGCQTFAQEICTLAAKEELPDVWRYLHASERDYIYYSTPKKTHAHIDFFLVDSAVLPCVASSSIGTITWSDHAPVSLSLHNGINTSGRPHVD